MSDLLCPKCKIKYDGGNYNGDYCELCGSQLLKDCPKCHEAIWVDQKDAHFCRKCGTNFFQGA